MSLKMRMLADGAVVKLTDKSFSGANLQRVFDHLAGLVDGLESRNLRLDLAEVEFLSGMALGKLVALHRKLQAAGGQLTLLNLKSFVYDILRVTHLDRILDVRAKQAG